MPRARSTLTAGSTPRTSSRSTAIGCGSSVATRDLINVGGQKVYPAEVEQAILELDDIEDVAVHGESHALLGQIVVAKVVTSRPESASDLKLRIRQACASKLAAFKLPTKVLLASSEDLYSVRLKKKRQA